MGSKERRERVYELSLDPAVIKHVLLQMEQCPCCDLRPFIPKYRNVQSRSQTVTASCCTDSEKLDNGVDIDTFTSVMPAR